MFELKKNRGVIFCGTREWCIIWRGIGLWVQNWHGKFNEFWPEHLKISKNCSLMGCLWPKYIIFELTNYRGVMFNDTEVWYRTWRRTNSCFPKMTWGIWQIITKPLESLKIATLMGSYDPKWKMYELKIYSGAMCHDKKKGCKIWTGIDLSDQNWHEKTLTRALESLKSLHFNEAAFDESI